MPELHPLSTAEVEDMLVRNCRGFRKASKAARKATDPNLQRFWHGQSVRFNTSRHTLAEVLGLLSGDPADEHYYDSLQAWEQEHLISLPPGCHIIPHVEVRPEERRRILFDMLRLARGPLRCCRRDIIGLLQEAERERTEESMRSLSKRSDHR